MMYTAMLQKICTLKPLTLTQMRCALNKPVLFKCPLVDTYQTVTQQPR